MYTKDFDYELPNELIARYPTDRRGDSRMLVMDRKNQHISHQHFDAFLDFLGPDDLVVLNDTQVIPARFYGNKTTGGKLEGLIERVIDTEHALVHLKASKRMQEGAIIMLDGRMRAEVKKVERLVTLRLLEDTSWLDYLREWGHMPLPPYFKRGDEALDQTRYQTVFAAKPGAVASPTASLHINEALLERIQSQVAHITLHVGSGTFLPVREDDLSQHQMHYEWLEVPEDTVTRIKATQARGGKILAVGTTVVRALESAAQSGALQAFTGETNLFITPGYDFRVVDKMLTNFHLPESTLLMLISAFAGYGFTQQAYQAAIAEQYRFFSYGDAMLII